MALDGGEYATLLARIQALEAELDDVRLTAEIALVPHNQAQPEPARPWDVVATGVDSVRVTANASYRNGALSSASATEITSISESGYVFRKHSRTSGWTDPEFAATLTAESTDISVQPIAAITFADGEITAITHYDVARLDEDTLTTNTPGVIDVTTTRDGPRAAFEVDHAIPEEDEDTVTSTLTMTPDDWIDIELLPDEAASRGVQIKRDLYGHIVGLRLDEFVFTHLFPVDPNGDETTLGAGEEGSETADTTTATISEVGAEGIAFWFVSRVVYDDAGDPPTLYAMMRNATFDARGHLFEVSGETAVSVDVTEDCTS
jgi:hypothetical protein